MQTDNEGKGDVTHRVRATIEPGVVREVGDAELLDLARQGLIDSYDRTDEAKAALGGEHFSTPSRWAAPKKGEAVVAPDAPLTEPTAQNEGE